VADRTRALAESEANVRFMLNEAPIAIAIFKGRNLIVDTANQKILEAWGKTKEIIGKPLHIGVPELQGQMFLKVLDNVFTSGEPFYGNEVKAMLKQNDRLEEVYANFVYHPFKNEAGETTHIMLIAQVVTEQVKSRKQAEHAEEMLRVSIEAANAGTWFMDATTRDFNASPRFKELFGFPPDADLTYEEVTARIPENYRAKVKTAVEMVMSNGESYHIEHPILAQAEGKETWVSARGKLYRNDEGFPLHFSGLMLDITQQKKDEIRKNDFIGMVSHELKTPLTSLSGYIQVLHRNAKKLEDSPTAEILNKAHGQLKKMTSMINGFLNISRLESGKIQLQKTTFGLDKLIRDMIEDNSVSSAAHKITLLPCAELMVNADRDKIGSVISNLLSNAIKYSPKRDQIIVICQMVDGMAQVSVQDEGLGIDAADVSRLFQRFYRVENKDNPHISGFGIGLYLSAEIVQHHGGNIWVESEKGKGSTFYFKIPANTEVKP
ncbi:MAG: PAS domain S-box protein, partial [Chryseobacterium sp.]